MNDENEQESICYRKQDFQLVCCILNSGKDSNWFIGRAFFIEGVFIWANIVSAIHQVCSRFCSNLFIHLKKKNKKDFHDNRAQLQVYRPLQVFHTNAKT